MRKGLFEDKAALKALLGNTKASTLLQEFLEVRALQQDQDFLNTILKRLVMRYSTFEQRLTKLNSELLGRQQQIDDDLEAASAIQYSLIPTQPPIIPGYEFGWKYEPCDQVGGDVFQIYPYDDEHVIMYILDVSGHGVPSAMVTVSVSQVLRLNSGVIANLLKSSIGDRIMLSPSKVLLGLEKEFPMDRFDKYFSMVYAVLHVKTGTLVYSNAGHPWPFLLLPDGELRMLDKSDGPVGFGINVSVAEGKVELLPGTKILFFTDGVLECRNMRNKLFGDGRLRAFLKDNSRKNLPELLDGLAAQIRKFRGSRKAPDDIAFFAFEYKGGESLGGSEGVG